MRNDDSVQKQQDIVLKNKENNFVSTMAMSPGFSHQFEYLNLFFKCFVRWVEFL